MRLPRDIDPLWFWCSCAAALLLLATAWLPLWTMRLHAPQYPRGLTLTAYGTRIEGDVQEVNTVNHYVGVEPVHSESIPELDFFPFLLGGLIALVVGGAFLARNWILRGVVQLSVWGFAIGFLADLQWWLYRSGHERNIDAPYRIDDFTPRVLGGTKVVNFTSETMVATGFWLILLAGLLVTFGPAVIRFVSASWQNTGDATSEHTQDAPTMAG
ncbi:MAG: hypothetical protein U0360_11000 [Dehalococcoidia bacterium]